MKNVPNADVDGRPIVETPGICGGNQADLEMAWRFVAHHRERIEEEIRDNELLCLEGDR